MNKKIKLALLVITLQLVLVLSASSQEIDLVVRRQLEEIKNELANQRSINNALSQKVNNLVNQQKDILDEVQNVNSTISNLSLAAVSSSNIFKDAFILDKKGVAFGFIDANLNIYDYNSGDLLGWIDPKTREVIRNFDQSVIAIYDNDFLIDETGHPIGSVERSEHLRWDREKMYSKTQKTPVSHFFVMNLPRRVFIPTNFRFNSWAEKHISETLYFDPEKVQSQN